MGYRGGWIFSLPGVVGRALLDFVYPPHCLVCGRYLEEARRYLCDRCWGEILVCYPHRCQRCSCPLEKEVPVCFNCRTWEPAFERVLIMGFFSGALQQAVHQLKFRGERGLGRELGRCLGRAPEFAGTLPEVDLLIPVPLHPARQRERGFNQSGYIAQGLAQVLGKPLRNDLLKRRFPTSPQAQLDAAARRQHLHGAFQVKGPLPGHTCIGLVDDVVTTGTTLDTCARTLVQAGATRVWGLALACPFHRPAAGRVLPAILS